MTPVDFTEANAHFGPPPGVAESQIGPIRAYCGPLQSGSLDGAQMVITAWKPSPLELMALNHGHPIFLTFIGAMPPHMVTTNFQSAISPQ